MNLIVLSSDVDPRRACMSEEGLRDIARDSPGVKTIDDCQAPHSPFLLVPDDLYHIPNFDPVLHPSRIA